MLLAMATVKTNLEGWSCVEGWSFVLRRVCFQVCWRSQSRCTVLRESTGLANACTTMALTQQSHGSRCGSGPWASPGPWAEAESQQHPWKVARGLAPSTIHIKKFELRLSLRALPSRIWWMSLIAEHHLVFWQFLSYFAIDTTLINVTSLTNCAAQTSPCAGQDCSSRSPASTWSCSLTWKQHCSS